jgi:hypothetical protein
MGTAARIPLGVLCGFGLLACSDEAPEGGAPPANATCDQYVGHVARQCPGFDVGVVREQCEVDLDLYAPIGCGSEYGAYLGCLTSAGVDCNTGEPAGCDDAANGYFGCQSAFASRVGCSRLRSNDSQCPSGQFGLGCAQGVPAGCTELQSPSAATIVCCPPFPD